MLFNLYIDVSRQACYNIATMGKGTRQKRPPGMEKYMAISDSQKRAVAKYNAANYDRIELRVEKGKKDIIKAHAEKRGESVNAFINRAIDETMERDNS